MDHPREKRRRIAPPLAAHVAVPDDLLFIEVLARLPVKCLVRFKCVCRSWRARMEDAGFVRRHRDFSRAAPPSMLVTPRKIYTEHKRELSEEDVAFYRLRPGRTPGYFEARAEELLLEEPACPSGITKVIHTSHCDGLIAVATTTNQVLVCNPATKELVALPLGSPDVNYVNHAAAAIGFDRWRNQYILARYFYRRWRYDESSLKFDYDIGHEVFALGGDSWELTVDPPPAIGGKPPVCAEDAFYWVCHTAEHPHPSPLLQFSLRDRTFEFVPCPPPEYGYHPAALDHLAELDGKLCYVNNGASLGTFDVWQLEDGARPAPQWSLRCHIDPGPGYDEAFFGCYGILPLWAAGGRMLAMVSDVDEKLYWCNEKSQGVEEVVDLEEDVDSELDDPRNYVHHVVPDRESLVSIRNCKV